MNASPHALATYTLADSATMLRRNLLHAWRYPSMTAICVGMPIFMLLLFVYVFGGSLGAGLNAEANGAVTYIDYVTPGIVLMTAAFGAAATAITVSTDMTDGIIARFRTMAISRASVLTGHVLGSMIQTLTSLGLVIGVAVLMGFRTTAGLGEWLAAIAFLALIALALTWLAVAFGLVSKNPEGASNITLPLQFLPFVSSAFVPTDSMPAGLAWFAENQPFTPIIETLRGLLMGTPIGNSGMVAVAWCVASSVVGYFWARALYTRDPSQ